MTLAQSQPTSATSTQPDLFGHAAQLAQNLTAQPSAVPEELGNDPEHGSQNVGAGARNTGADNYGENAQAAPGGKVSIPPDVFEAMVERVALDDDWRIRNAHKKEAREAFEKAKRKETPWSWRGDACENDFYETTRGHAMRSRESNELALCEIADTRRQSDYVEHCVNLAGERGVTLTQEAYAESVQRRWQRWQDSLDLAHDLEAAGIPANFTDKPGRPRPSIVCPISRVSIPLPVIRRVNFFPEQAASRRAPMLKEVENYLVRHPWARMATFTAGERVPTPEIRETHAELTRRISRMASEKWFKARAELVFRGSEFGTPKLSAKTGDWTWHVHAHTVFSPRRAFPKKWWSKFLKRVGRTMGAHWDAGKPVENARELVKYPVKPADLAELRQLGGPVAIADFFRATYKLRITETLGSLREQRSETRRWKKKRVKELNADGDFVHATRENWNKRGRPVTRDEESAEGRRRRALTKAKQKADMARGFCKVKPKAEGTAPMNNRIVARLAPAPYACRAYEPAAYVWNFDGDFDAIAQHRSMKPALASVEKFVARRVAFVRQHDAAGAAGQQRPHQSRICPAAQLDAPLVNAPPDRFARHLAAISA